MKRLLNILLVLQLILVSAGCCMCSDCAKKQPKQDQGQDTEPKKQ